MTAQHPISTSTTTGWPGEGLLLAGRYRLDTCLATGSTATVWAATDEQLRRPVAIKLLLPHRAADDVAMARFRAEARATVKAAHVNSVRVYDALSDGQYTFIVMELIEGGPLSLFEGQQLDPVVVAAMGTQVAAALGAAHDHDLIHRDVKPANILVEDSGWVKVVDFGIAKALDDPRQLTATSIALGTARYLAPEQLTDEPIGPWTDVYALGLVLWEACAGRPVFEGSTIHATALARVQRDVPSVATAAPGVPGALTAVIDRATQRDPSRRYAHGREMADALKDVSGTRPHIRTGRLTRRYARTDAPVPGPRVELRRDGGEPTS